MHASNIIPGNLVRLHNYDNLFLVIVSCDYGLKLLDATTLERFPRGVDLFVKLESVKEVI
jgi:hypothetical protein